MAKPNNEPAIGIGSTIWRFDGNYRVYPKDNNGRGNWSDGPIYREHWRPITIDTETSRSWVSGPKWAQYKIPKRGPHLGFALTQQEVDDDVWVHEHLPNIQRQMYGLKDANVIRQIAELIGYQGVK